MEILSYSPIIPIRKSDSGGETMSHSEMNGVRRISPVEALTDQSIQERVVSGEVLGRNASAHVNESSNSGFTFDQKKEYHPGFYPKYDVLGNKAQRAIDMYTVNAQVTVSNMISAKPPIVDYFI